MAAFLLDSFFTPSALQNFAPFDSPSASSGYTLREHLRLNSGANIKNQ